MKKRGRWVRPRFRNEIFCPSGTRRRGELDRMLVTFLRRAVGHVGDLYLVSPWRALSRMVSTWRNRPSHEFRAAAYIAKFP